MLSLMRNFARSRAAMVIIAFLIIGLAAYALPNVFSGGPTRGIISAGDRFVVRNDVNRLVDLQIQAAAEANQRFSRKDIADSGLVMQMVQSLAQQTAQLAFADEEGVRASRYEVSRRITQNPAFIDSLSGEFTPEAYQEILLRNNLTTRQFEADLRDDTTRSFYESALNASIDVPDALGSVRGLIQSEERFVSYVTIPASVADSIEVPSEEELRSFFDSNNDLFREPERRAISVLSISADDLIDDVELSDAELRDYYEFRIKDYSTPETRRIFELKASERILVQHAFDQIGAGGDVREVATQLEGVDLRERVLIPSDVSDEAYRRAVFAAEQDVPSPPFQGESEVWTVFVVTKITPGIATPFEQVADEVREKLATDEAPGRLDDLLEQIYDLVGGGFSLEEMSVQIGAPVISLQAIDSSGRMRSGDFTNIFAGRPDALNEVLSLTPTLEGEASAIGLNVSDIIDDPVTDGYIIFRLDRVVESHIPEFEAIKMEVLQTYIERLRSEAVANASKELTDMTQSSGSFESAANSLGYTIITPETPISAMSYPQEASIGALRLASTAEEGQTVSFSEPDGSMTVMHVNERRIPSLVSLPQLANLGKVQMREEISADLNVAFMSALYETVEVEFNQEDINDLIRSMRGEE